VKGKGGFPVQVGVVLIGAVLLLTYPLAKWGTAEILTAVVAGALLSTANVLAGYAAIEYSFNKSYTTFVKAVIGGMGLRMVVMLGALAALIVFGGLHPVALTSSLMGFYAVFLILEILYIQKKVSLKNQG
jgi:hypothetical protein